jgi:hypothetical protein
MTRGNFEQAMRNLLNRQPFRPFVIEFDDGERWVVGQPEALMYSDGGTAVFFRQDGSFDFVDSEAVRGLLELSAVTPN